jgi:hypothetical protein
MFCPKCGQQQATDEMRFCSRCGFQLGVVAALISTGGVPPAVIISNAQVDSRLPAKRRTRQGAKLMFASGVVSPIAMAFSIMFDSPVPLLIPFTIFLAGLTWMLYFRWFGEDESSSAHQSPATQLVATNQAFLPSPQTLFVEDSVRQANSTAEIVRPPSVTEHTTKLLDVDGKT